MFTWLARKSDSAGRARELYGAVVTQAREPAFYSDFGVADTAEGRYEMIALHLVMVMERLGQSDVADDALRRDLLETFVTDMDDSMREMGVGDMSVGRRVKKAAGGIYTRAAAYGAALSVSDDVALADALYDYAYLGKVTGELADAQAAVRGEAPPQLAALARYVRQTAAFLAAQPAADLHAGRVSFEAPTAERSSPAAERSSPAVERSPTTAERS